MRASSLDHLVGEREQIVGDSEAERLGGFQVDDEMELGRLLHGQIRRLRTLENPAAVDADLAECVGPVRSVAHQPASCGKGAVDVDRRQTVLQRQRRNLGAAVEEQSVGSNHESARSHFARRWQGLFQAR
jgi:hypothetical protein